MLVRPSNLGLSNLHATCCSLHAKSHLGCDAGVAVETRSASAAGRERDRERQIYICCALHVSEPDAMLMFASRKHGMARSRLRGRRPVAEQS